MYDTTDDVVQYYDKQLKEHISLVEEQFIMLKKKVAVCARTCYQTDGEIRQALTCEQECHSSIPKMEDFIKTRNEGVERKLQMCISEFSADIDNPDEDSNPLDNHYGTCIKNFTQDLVNIQKEIFEEFNFYQ